MKSRQIRSSLLLVLTALIWGMAFVAQRRGMNHVEPFTFNAVRFALGGLALLPAILWRRRRSAAPGQGPPPENGRTLLMGGAICGVVLFAASALQQVGIHRAETASVNPGNVAGKAAFLTALYIIIVPLLGILRGRLPSRTLWLCVALAGVGVYLLCVGEGLSFGPGDDLMLLCALAFSLHILVIDHYSPRVDGVAMAAIQFFVAALLCVGPMLALERPTPEGILDARIPLFYAGVLSCGVAYTLQIVAQKEVNPTLASLILSLESVFAALTEFVIEGDALTGRKLAGCALMLLAILLAQLPGARKKKEDAHGPV